MVEKIFVIGDAARCKRRLDDYARGGITTTALQFSSFAKSPEERRKKILSAIEKLAAAY
jgi:alkanesulfonate monooxygenase SsuD/methylene tetrahydromethanopterin reductase-like flavin-dependent oxidoreductase (luciferase family)